MDPVIAMQEAQSNNGPRTYKKPFLNFLDRLSLSFIVVVFCVIVVFSPIWLQFSNSFFLFTIPRVINYILNPKVLFILTNVIVIILIGESRISRPRSSLPASALLRSHSYGLWSNENVRVEMGYQRFLEENIDRPRLGEGKICKLSPLEMDSLNQRADDLIARVNRQRRLEIGLLHRRIDEGHISL
ncbi:unnamed protein product [Arabidopsis thaliana]|uniref:Transmembrane protein n=3 Tax=Arabidopsis TaxID=3701 RepID=Q9LUF0_ARATH|nr:uncharacterized protein AT5G50610 [Arabidopsis thaliana]NP_568743.1 uncharacterized protein AT5G50710 [Arabidopsis thaliana]KAG7612542.1 hypothetical protein ISN44_As05g045490 [Arabidopsis suecica]ABE65578.1 hypothetical protein At5g50610 [Arabidopsis thaliana]AED95968.1 transmembrane protein [Arabidopsis thaliana]AED95982.1 transmembrane protein [Arabidopsis thaliana]BAA96984.1 unnamed protein product [Arabidopsis thaliana]|eukprot:NP_568733.1 transmembrane protein [Arabidopsis thaliana]